MTRRQVGIGLALALGSAATFSTSGSFASSLMSAGWSPGATVTTRVGVAALVLTPLALLQLRGRWSDLWSERWSVLVFGAVAVAACQLAFFQALQHLPVGIALLLEYSGTLMIVGWAWAVRGHRPSPVTGVGIAVSVVGLVLVLQVWRATSISVVGVVWGLLAAVGLAVYFVVSSRAHTDVPPLASAWAGMTTGALALLLAGVLGVMPLHVGASTVVLHGASVSWVVPVLGLSVVAAVVAYSLGIAGTRRLGATTAGFVGLTEVLFAVLFAWALLGQRPAAVQALGGMTVLVGIVVVRLGESRADPLRTPADGVLLAEPSLP